MLEEKNSFRVYRLKTGRSAPDRWPAAVRFLSVEPMREDIGELPLGGWQTTTAGFVASTMFRTNGMFCGSASCVVVHGRSIR